MKELNIKKTKRSLAIAFSVIVFVVVYILWIVFFSAKYVTNIRIEKNNFHRFINIVINRGADAISTSMTTRPEIEFFRESWHNSWWFRITTEPIVWTNFTDFINYILLDGNDVLVNNIRDNIPEKIILSSIESDEYFEEKQEHSFLVRKLKLRNGKTFIVYKRLNYSFSNYLDDVLWFFLVLVFFTLLVYFIWNKFVNKVFLPVEKNLKDMNDFVHNAGHELKTPLSVIDSNIQMIKESRIYDEKMINELKNEVIKLNSLIDSLVELSNIDFFKDLEELNLKDCIDEVINDLKMEIKKKKIIVNIEIKENVFVKANKNYLYIFLSNIVGNAVKYNKKGWSIDIQLAFGELIVKDTWVWIKKEDISKIFDRFYKGDTSRNSQWFWIWLSLVKKIADIYKWKIEVESEEWEGTDFKVKF